MKTWAKVVDPLEADRVFLTAAVAAVIAAIFTVTIWAPLQMRAFTRAVETATIPESLNPNVQHGWMNIPFTTADGTSASLASSNGRVRVVTMMYTHCPGMCPMAVATLQQMESRLTAAQRSRVAIVALSLDPAQDTLARLQQYRMVASKQSPRWIVGKPAADRVRQLASALDVTYRTLDDGTLDHQSVFVLLDPSGRMVARTSNTRNIDSAFFGALQAVANGR